MVAMIAGGSGSELWLLGQIAAIAVIGVMIYFGYRWMMKNDRNKPTQL